MPSDFFFEFLVDDTEFPFLKAALFFISLTMDEMTMYNVKWVIHSDQPTKNYHQMMQFSFPRGILASLSKTFSVFVIGSVSTCGIKVNIQIAEYLFQKKI